MASKQEMLLAVLAVKQGLIQPQRVQECMDIQRMFQEKKNQEVPLVQIFMKKGYLTKEQIATLQQGPAAPAGPQLAKTVTLEQAKQIETYDFVERIGEGGVATVFRAVDPDSGEERAVKILFPVHAANPVFVQRFLDEGRFLTSMDHPNIVKGYEANVWPPGGENNPPDQKFYYAVMELVRGYSVQQDLNDNGPMPEAKALHIIVQIAEALEYLQEHNCVHRDIKPDNILYGYDGQIKLCDLGFAKEIEEAGEEGETEDTTCGTVQYISPEQARGLKDVDIRADIYSLGATLYHLVVGEVPFGGKDSMEIMAAQVLNSLNSDKYRKRGLSHYMGYFIEKMMAKEREVRYQTPREVIDDINQVVGGAASLTYNADNDPMVQKLSAVGGKSNDRRAGASTERRGGARPVGARPGTRSVGARPVGTRPGTRPVPLMRKPGSAPPPAKAREEEDDSDGDNGDTGDDAPQKPNRGKFPELKRRPLGRRPR